MHLLLQSLRRKLNKKITERSGVIQSIKTEKESVIETKELLSNTTEAREIMQIVAQIIQQSAHEQVSRVVSKCLEMVFYDESYGFRIRFEKKRHKTEARLLLLNKGHEIEKPLEEDSGGVCDIASFALRVSCLMLSKPQLRRLLVMDEPFKNVSEEYRDNTRIMLEELSKDFDIQFILVTHEQGFKCGKIVHL